MYLFFLMLLLTFHSREQISWPILFLLVSLVRYWKVPIIQSVHFLLNNLYSGDRLIESYLREWNILHLIYQICYILLWYIKTWIRNIKNVECFLDKYSENLQQMFCCLILKYLRHLQLKFESKYVCSKFLHGSCFLNARILFPFLSIRRTRVILPFYELI